jgi:hypothetical protein
MVEAAGLEVLDPLMGLLDHRLLGAEHDRAGRAGLLHHADQPQLYNGLPKDPRISPLIAFWKGGAKVFGLATIRSRGT